MTENQLSRTAPAKRKRRRKENGCLGTFLYILFVIGVSLLLSIVAIFSVNDFCAFVKDDVDIDVRVTESTTVSALAHSLDETGIINYNHLFGLYVKLADKDGQVNVGTYTLNPTMDYNQIIRTLKGTDSSSNTVNVTIPEGYTIEQIRQTLIDAGVCTAEDLDEALNNYNFKHEFLQSMLPAKENWLEGYLFPDTYTFYQNNSGVKTINKMLNNFNNQYDEKIKEGADKLGYSMQEVVIIASMIEREAKLDDEFARISGVIYNRLHSSNFPYLQIDATIQYAVGHKETLTEEDLKVDSPYNTYTHQGLPPGPICNPGYTALYAATHPEEHNYYYYVAVPDGSHLFASSQSEHQKNIEKAKTYTTTN
jgi:UPF0755 protein